MGEGDQDSDEPGEAHKTRRSLKQRLALTGLIGLILVCLLGIGAAAYGIHLLGRIERIDDVALDQVIEGDPINYLIIGTDERGDGDGDGHDGPALADSIVLFRVDPEEQEAAVISFPRDLLVPLAIDDEFDPNGTPQQLNHASRGENGRANVADTLRQNFAIPIHHYIEINFDGFRSLIDTVGGVDVWVDQAIHDPKTGLEIYETGCVNLDAEHAMMLVRSRDIHTMGENGWERRDLTADIGRNTRQREFIQQAVGKAIREAPSDPRQLLRTMENLAGTVAIDETISLSSLAELAQAFRDLDPNDEESFRTFQLPVVEAASDENRVVLSDLHAEPMLNVFRGWPEDSVSPRAIEVSVLNGTGEENEATNVAGAFQALGFKLGQIGDIGELEEGPMVTTVYHRSGEEHLGLRVAQHVTGSVWIAERDDLAEGEVEVVTGASFESLHEIPTDPDDMPDTTPPDSDDSGLDEAGEDAIDAIDEPGSDEDDTSDPDDEEDGPAGTTSTTVPELEDNTFQLGAGGSCA